MRQSGSPRSLRGRRAVVMGLGRFGGGVGVTRWLVGQGAEVLVTDAAPAEKLSDSVAALSDLPIAWALGGHDASILDGRDLLVVNPAVPDRAPLLLAAQDRAIELTSEINLFMQRCPAPMVGITGTVGKSTTAAMTAAVLATTRRTHLGGNIGVSLLDKLDGGIEPDDIVVLELSSFQLDRLCWLGLSPSIALVTNLAANHLDRHGTMDAYARAKKNIFKYQKSDDLLLLPAGDDVLAGWAAGAPGRCEWFSGDRARGVSLRVPGDHNRANAAAALAIASALHVDSRLARSALEAFAGLPHRLQFVCERDGVRFYNDSKATTPDGVRVALESFDPGRVIAIVGGYDKKIPLDGMCKALAERARRVIATGDVGPQIVALIEQCNGHRPADYAAEFDDAVALAMSAARRGDVVLLSPGCASYGQFTNYEQRGERFCELVATK